MLNIDFFFRFSNVWYATRDSNQRLSTVNTLTSCMMAAIENIPLVINAAPSFAIKNSYCKFDARETECQILHHCLKNTEKQSTHKYIPFPWIGFIVSPIVGQFDVIHVSNVIQSLWHNSRWIRTCWSIRVKKSFCVITVGTVSWARDNLKFMNEAIPKKNHINARWEYIT